MTWLNFFMWLLGLYGAYYLLNILFDLTYKKFGAVQQDDILELNFLENAPVQIVTYEPEKPVEPQKTIQPEPASKGTGGVTLMGIFDLARSESIHLTKQVSF